MATKRLVEVKDKDVLNIWACAAKDCPNNGKEITVNPDFYQGVGAPTCNECSDDMAYIRTEVAL